MIAPWTTTSPARLQRSGRALVRHRSLSHHRHRPAVAAAGEQLVLSGIPLYRLAYFQLTLHPEFAGQGLFLAPRPWRRDRRAPARRLTGRRIPRQSAAAGVRAAQDRARAPRPDRAAGADAAAAQGRGRDRLCGPAAALHHRPCRCAERRVGQRRAASRQPTSTACSCCSSPSRASSRSIPCATPRSTCSTPMSAAPPASASWPARSSAATARPSRR